MSPVDDLKFGLEEYDHGWGGWRPVRGTWLTEEPAQFASVKDAAEAAWPLMVGRSHARYRVVYPDGTRRELPR